jgi:hypothetical protein
LDGLERRKVAAHSKATSGSPERLWDNDSGLSPYANRLDGVSQRPIQRTRGLSKLAHEETAIALAEPRLQTGLPRGLLTGLAIAVVICGSCIAYSAIHGPVVSGRPSRAGASWRRSASPSANVLRLTECSIAPATELDLPDDLRPDVECGESRRRQRRPRPVVVGSRSRHQ